jgi:hypothetical protein
VGETRVDLLHLLEDLRDAYPGPLEETVVSEIVANALDSRARTIGFVTDLASRTLTVSDDGAGMSRAELRRYHDLAASTKTRGKGIGFAGVGIKLGLLACDEVLTETRRTKSHVATRWQLTSRHRAPWHWGPPPGLLASRGTAVRLTVTNPLSALLDPSFLAATVRRQFAPLLDPSFAALLARSYPAGVRFLVNGAAVTAEEIRGERAALAIRVGRQRKPSAVGHVVLSDAPLPDDRRGLAVSTLGKVIKRGWDWLGLAPATVTAERLTGLVEVPPLAAALTLSKGDFLRTGRPGMLYLSYRKALQEAVGERLAAWGDDHAAAAETRRPRRRPLERVLRAVLAELADDFPLLASLVDWSSGGQRRLAIGGGAARGQDVGLASVVPEPVATPADEPAPETSPTERGRTEQLPSVGDTVLPSSVGSKRPAHAGLLVDFESRPQDPALGRLVESTVWVNESHPAYRRAAVSRAEEYHVALTVAMTLAPLAVEPGHVHQFVTTFLERWGTANGTGPARHLRRPRRVTTR